VRLYILECTGLNAKDDNSNSDPYLIVKLGKEVYNESKNYLDDEPNPKFYKLYEFHTVFPGASRLSISVYDHDTFVADDLIGKTAIDLEDRFFSRTWRNLAHKPIETRQLFNPSSRMS